MPSSAPHRWVPSSGFEPRLLFRVSAGIRERVRAFTFGTLLVVALSAQADSKPIWLGDEARRAAVSRSGVLLELRDGTRSWKGEATTPGVVLYGDARYPLESLKCKYTRNRNSVEFRYQVPGVPGLVVNLKYRLQPQRGNLVLRREIILQSSDALPEDLTVRLPLGLSSDPEGFLLPGQQGDWIRLDPGRGAKFRSAGEADSQGDRIALPVITYTNASPASRVSVYSDAFFSAHIDREGFRWTYPATTGLENGRETRIMDLVIHAGDPSTAIAAFYSGILPDVPAGPAWLHEIAMVNYDYLSDGGQGWFRDIDALVREIMPEDRHRIFLCLHGWYDFLGRYCFDFNSRQLDAKWTAFSNAPVIPKFLKGAGADGRELNVGFPNAQSLSLTPEDITRRLKYARSRGFRVGLYFADGLAAGEGLPDFHSRRVLYWGGWLGPDTQGRTYIQNPLLPEVREFYIRYLDALLEQFGSDMDALVWDETFHVPAGTRVEGPHRGYPDRAMLLLADQLRHRIDEYNRPRKREIALLVSDCAGIAKPEGPPTALFGHGTYQDSSFRPEAWKPAIFPNFRNVVWSCCWWPFTWWNWVEQGVEEFGAPVPLSNGWGDDTGFSEMTESQRRAVLELFHARKNQAPDRFRSIGNGVTDKP